MFQHPLLLAGRVAWNAEVPLWGRGIARRERRERARAALARFGIAALAERDATTLSGGEARRLALARAFVVAPDVLLLDEPFDDLDAAGREALVQDLASAIRETDIAVAIVTHDLRQALLLADRIAVLCGGALAQLDARDAVLRRPANAEVAALVGMSNWLPGRVRSRDAAGLAAIELAPAATLRAATACAAGTRRVGGDPARAREDRRRAQRPEHARPRDGRDARLGRRAGGGVDRLARAAPAHASARGARSRADAEGGRRRLHRGAARGRARAAARPDMSTSAGAPAALEVTIESLAAGGEGVGHDASGRVVFVPFAAAGDRLRVRVVEEHARFARGEIEALLAPGADRVAPRCPVFGSCGGCAWQHVGYPAQVAAKRAILHDALARIGGVEAPPIEFVASPQAYGYRGRARVLVEGGRVGFRMRRSHEVCAITACPLLAPPLDAALASSRRARRGEDGEWELALGSDGAVRTTPLGARARAGERVAVRAAGEQIEVSSGVFMQANALLHGALAQSVLDAAGQGGEVLELFAGAGFFTLGLARHFARVAAVESDAAAVADLSRNCAAAGLRHVRVIEAPAEDVLAMRLARYRLAPDVVVLDPPRGGIGTRASERLARLPAQRIVHVSCDPATLARDLRVLTRARWSLLRVIGFDLFPQTPHVEAIAVLERAGANRSS